MKRFLATATTILPLPAAVEVRPVPGYVDYRYALVNNQRVIVDPRTRRVIRVIEY